MTGRLLLEVIAFFAGVGLTACLAGLAYCSYMLWRNQQVHAFRMSLLYDSSLAAYEAWPSYEEMMRRWWVWPLERFAPERPDV